MKLGCHYAFDKGMASISDALNDLLELRKQCVILGANDIVSSDIHKIIDEVEKLKMKIGDYFINKMKEDESV